MKVIKWYIATMIALIAFCTVGAAYSEKLKSDRYTSCVKYHAPKECK